MWFWIILVVIIVIIGLVVFNQYCKYKQNNYQTTMLKRMNEQSIFLQTETIFVSIWSYKDPEVAKTIYNLFAKSYFPFNITIGVCDQRDFNAGASSLIQQIVDVARTCQARGDTNVFSKHPEHFFSNQVRVEEVPSSFARGPVIARAMIEKRLYAGEKYYMMIDSAMRFVDAWDQKALETFHACSSAKPILTFQPASYDLHTNDPNLMLPTGSPPTSMTAQQFDSRSSLPKITSRFFQNVPSRPSQQLFWTPTFSFTFAAAHLEVPYDPYLRALTEGEEFIMSVRFWCAGWDFYNPSEMLCLQSSINEQTPNFAKELRLSDQNALSRLHCLLGMRPRESVHQDILKEAHIYGPQSNRSLIDYQKFCDINLKSRKIGRRARAGVTEDAPNDEILAKFGSFNNFRNYNRQQGTSLIGR